MRFFALLASLFLVGLPPSAGIAGSSGLQLAGSANLGDWQTYTNARFGTGIDYPAGHFLSGTPPTNGDGLEFTGADGISGFVIFGRYNVDELPMSGLMSEDMSATSGTSPASKKSAYWVPAMVLLEVMCR